MYIQFKKTAIAAAVVGSLTMGSTASADIITASFDGLFTLLSSGGSIITNDDNQGAPWYGQRSVINGTLNFDTSTGTGSGTIAPFSFLGSGDFSPTGITFQSIGDGGSGPGTLLLSNMSVDWNGSTGFGVSLVMDAAGFFGAVTGGLSTSDTIAGVGALAATDALTFGNTGYTLPIGPSPIVSTTFNTTTITNTAGTTPYGTNPSGVLPLTDDGIGGSPMPNGPFQHTNANIDITSIHIEAYATNPVPVPAALWLFGSGVLGLIGVAGRRKRG